MFFLLREEGKKVFGGLLVHFFFLFYDFKYNKDL